MEHVYNVASDYAGMEEWPGAKHNPEVLAMFGDVGHSWVQDDETPWCAAFVGSVLASCGLPQTGKLNARSYLAWGQAVAFNDMRKGDVCVFWRKSRTGPYGHVAFFDHYDEETDMIHVLGGNQGNKVCIAAYPNDRLIEARRMELKAPEKAPRDNITQSKTVQGTLAGGIGAATTGFAAIGSLEGNAQLVAIGGLVVVGLALAFIFKERLRKWAAGDR